MIWPLCWAFFWPIAACGRNGFHAQAALVLYGNDRGRRPDGVHLQISRDVLEGWLGADPQESGGPFGYLRRRSQLETVRLAGTPRFCALSSGAWAKRSDRRPRKRPSPRLNAEDRQGRKARRGISPRLSGSDRERRIRAGGDRGMGSD